MFLSRRNQIVLLLLFLFISISIFVYFKYVKPRLNPSYIENKEFLMEKGDENISKSIENVELIIFHTTWCPHSKTALKTWKKIKENRNNSIVNKYRVLFKEVDCDKDEEIADAYNIEGYPTIKLIKNNGKEIIEFDAKLTEETCDEFLNSTLH